ncbi:MAG: class I SAM-dependent rRNA methyltransferase, partial [Anaerolineales bacterium]|nr:class I SAM-dependent rRNA methyltransferase [Anaerolineales bacterium]
QRHPWIFSGAVQRLEGQANAGDLVHIVAADDTWLACAYYNPHSQIQARVLSWDLEESIDEAFWERRLARAIAGRTALQLAPQTNALRLVNAESDDLPGLIVDQYGDFLVLQSQTAGIERWKQMLVDLLAARVGPAGILERSDLSIRKKEGLSPVSGLLWGQPPPDLLTVHENGHPFQVDLRHGHKTGLYLDQRDNRALVCQPRFVAGKRLLNVFSYTGGFAVYAAAAGARAITNLDSSVDVLRLAEANVQLTAPQRPD